MNLDLAVQNNPYLVAVLGDFNGKLKNWYGCYKTNFEGNVLETPFSQFGLNQMISNSTHVSNTYSLCVDLIFTTQPNLVVESRRSPILTFKFCGNSICKPLEIIYKECFRLYLFPLEWKKGNRVPVHKKGDKLCLKNYRSVSLLTVCGKILEKLIFDKMFQFFIKNELISTNQSVQASTRWIIPYANATQT